MKWKICTKWLNYHAQFAFMFGPEPGLFWIVVTCGTVCVRVCKFAYHLCASLWWPHDLAWLQTIVVPDQCYYAFPLAHSFLPVSFILTYSKGSFKWIVLLHNAHIYFVIKLQCWVPQRSRAFTVSLPLPRSLPDNSHDIFCENWKSQINSYLYLSILYNVGKNQKTTPN